MRIPTHKAAQMAGLHPAEFVLAVARMVGSLDECWPKVDEALVQTVIAMRQPRTEPATAQPEPSPPRPAEPELPVSGGAARLLDKLCRHGKWGDHHTPWDELHNHLGRGIPDLDDVVDELVQLGLLVQHDPGPKGRYSLRTGRKAEIERIVSALRTAGNHRQP